MPKNIIVLGQARSGSTAFMELLGSHPQIVNFGEIFNEHCEQPAKKDADALCAIVTEKIQENKGQQTPKQHTAIKVLTSQLDELNLSVELLMHRCELNVAIIIWRCEAVETLVSALIARRTGQWYSNSKYNNNNVETVSIAADKLQLRLTEEKQRWIKMFEHWPIEVQPIFVQYEWLFSTVNENTLGIAGRMADIFSQIGIANCDFVKCYAKKQNPAPIDQKLTNWAQLPRELREHKIDVPALFESTIGRRFGLPPALVHSLVPDREPRVAASVEGFRIRVAEPFIPQASIDFVNEALRTGSISSAGDWPQRLAQRLRDLFHYPVAIPCCNGFVSLVLALQSANVNAGDTVIVPALTMIAVPNAVQFVGARPIFVDVAVDEYNPSWTQIEAAATASTKAVIIAHTYGSPVRDIEHIADGCRRRAWVLIEDISECVGIKMQTATGERLLGTFGDYACASMYANKIVHAGDGGFLIARSPDCAVRLTSINNHGFTKTFHFVHFEPSINGKINGLGAAVACGVLDNLDYIMQHRASLAKWYRHYLADVVTQQHLQLMPNCGIGDTPWVFGIHCHSKKQRTKLRQHLAYSGIETRDYFFPLHLQPSFKNIADELQRLPNAERLGSCGFYLPTHTNLTEEKTAFISSVICSFFHNVHPANNLSIAVQPVLKTKNPSKMDAELFDCEILEKARKCFEGLEFWDDKKELIRSINEHCSKTSAFGPLEQSLLAYTKYFQSSMTVEMATCGSLKSEELIANLENMIKNDVKEVFLIEEQNKNDSIFEYLSNIAKAENVKFATINYSKKSCDMHLNGFLNHNGNSLKNNELIVVNLIDTTDEHNSDLENFCSVFANHIANRAVFLFGVKPEHLPILSALSVTHSFSGKRSGMRLYEPITKVDVKQDWEQIQALWNRPLKRKLKFIGDPGWDHHHQNAFACAIDALRVALHSDHADVLFISAVEQYICDTETMPQQPWIGIIHGLPNYYDQFYVPDLHRLCTKARFRPWLRRCRGLLTLTSAQAAYLEQHLRPTYCFPIVPVHYPCVPSVEVSMLSSVAAALKDNRSLDIYFIGSFDRDFEYFFNAKFPANLRKILLVCDWQTPTTDIPNDVHIVERVDSVEYERILRECIIFLSLKQGGAANTLVIECITRNTPIIVPRISSITDYIGELYPLLYDFGTTDFTDLITDEVVQKAIDFLQTMDKEHLSQANFVKEIQCSAIIEFIPHCVQASKEFDVTITICSYRRTHNLSSILTKLLYEQTHKGRVEIIVWNNNHARQRTVEDIINKLQPNATQCQRIRLELISSSENHFCSVRFAMPQLMHSDKLLICDDDIIPGSDFISFFLRNHAQHPNDVLCTRGHYFLPHKTPNQNPHQIWTNYDCVRFCDDSAAERLIHYVHADVCLIPKSALREVASVEPPDNDFMLVDDYWMSYVLSAKFGRNLRKLAVTKDIVSRTEDSDQIGLAMHTRPEVANARTRMYLQHMCNGWPCFVQPEPLINDAMKQFKIQRWAKHRMGVNINSEITLNEMDMLQQIGFSFVRVGIVGAGRDEGYEFSELNVDHKNALSEMEVLVNQLEKRGIDVIIVLDRRLAKFLIWQAIAERLGQYRNVIGYDLLNEPFTEQNHNLHWMEVKSGVEVDATEFKALFHDLIEAVRSRDRVTPIIIETPFWANIATLECISIDELKKIDDNLIASIHFYLPQLLTWRKINDGRFSFPGPVPVYDKIAYSETIYWSPETIDKEFEVVDKWMQRTGIPVFVGEFGISRDVIGADAYLKAVAGACQRRKLFACLYAFRDPDWEVMDYELGDDANNQHTRCIDRTNKLYGAIKELCAEAIKGDDKNE